MNLLCSTVASLLQLLWGCALNILIDVIWVRAIRPEGQREWLSLLNIQNISLSVIRKKYCFLKIIHVHRNIYMWLQLSLLPFARWISTLDACKGKSVHHWSTKGTTWAFLTLFPYLFKRKGESSRHENILNWGCQCYCGFVDYIPAWLKSFAW